MEVNTEITRKDMIWLNLLLLPRMRWPYIFVASIALLVIAYHVWRCNCPFTIGHLTRTIMIALFSGIVGLLITVTWDTAFYIFSISRKDGTLGPHQYKISPEGIFVKTSVDEGTRKWEGIFEIITLKPFLLFQTASDNYYFIVPKRYFSSDQEFQGFVQQAQTFWNNAQNRTEDLSA